MPPKDPLLYYSLEIEIMHEFSMLPPGSFKARNVMIDEVEHIHCMEINVAPEVAKPRLLMIHGYGGNNVFFFRMYRHLAHRFHIFSMDLPGMGFNYRAESEPAFGNLEQCLDFFVERINKFVEAVEWERFSLAGHSMGAYFSSQFFDRYTYKVEKLFLLSPAAFNGAPDSSERHIEERLRTLPLWQREIARRAMHKMLRERKTPFELLGASVRNFAIRVFMHSKRMSFSPREAFKLTALNRYLLGLPQCGEKCIWYVIDLGLRSRAPVFGALLRHLDRLADVTVVYGEHDTMDYDTSLRSAAALEIPVQFYQLPACDHQLIVQRPDVAAALLLAVFDGRPEQVAQYRMDSRKYMKGLKSLPLEP